LTDSGPTGREWGDLSRHVEEIRHDIRNMRTILDGYVELIIDLERRCANLETKIYTSVGVCAVLFGLVGSLINWFF